MSKKKKLILVSVVAVILLLIVIFAFSRNDKAADPAARDMADKVQDAEKNDNAEDNTDAAQLDTNAAPSPNQPANNPPVPPPAPAVPIISLTGKQQAGQIVQVSAIVKNLTAGTCQATFTGPQGTQPMGRTSPIVNKGNFYGCTDMNIPVADFSKSGIWHMTIFAANQNNKSNIAEADILVTK